MAKFHIKTGDTVMVIAGTAKGQSGRVIRMIPKQHRAVIEGLNLVTKHQKPSATSPQGGIVKMEAPIHLSNLMLMIGDQATRVGRRIEDGKVVRYAKKTGDIIK
ncbi:MAG: 50S ribosomal protein L24 [Schleiferiaceae bacterium]|jgi:large subunit ribosomal protein L24|nr:50S ribosomal protein L24 [Flavobacteriales bacterium]MDA9256007.1 50S ribosomal protein L24 [Schleiferiaceae bacterium]NCF57185.1 50S ribosomal protein L24 [Bacteroidota bacterium]NCG44165.1 50S ribosomal protein L24 [Pseudomonadota bacterium]MBT3571920.1 50S ribosomal protein L24 [Flavobacteriales bacterium]|tara:strand:+ start:13697 stop:14008 length:312 start_codon:yes stop_codon:yes gene_type:complete